MLEIALLLYKILFLSLFSLLNLLSTNFFSKKSLKFFVQILYIKNILYKKPFFVHILSTYLVFVQKLYKNNGPRKLEYYFDYY
mgnify:CR=1 FL=1